MAAVFTIDHTEASAVIPIDENASNVIYPLNCTLGTNGWSLRVIHMVKYHSCSYRVAFTKALN